MQTYQTAKMGLFLDKGGNTAGVLEQIISYYEQNKDEGNRVRDPLELMKTINEGQFYYIIDENNILLGVSACFTHFDAHYEAGGTRVTKNGFGLQKYFHYVRLLQTLLFDHPAGVYFTIIWDKNTKSISNTEKSGFTEWSPSGAFKAEVKHLEETEGRNILYYRVCGDSAIQAVQKAAQAILTLHHNPLLIHRETGEKLALSIDLPFVRHPALRKILEEYAEGHIKADIPC